MLNEILDTYIKDLQKIINRGDYREESLYHCLKDMIDGYARLKNIESCEISILPKATEAGNPDFRIWDGKARITGYIEAKNPRQYNLDPIAASEQLLRYRETFPNLILTNFYEFQLYSYGQLVDSVTIASPINATQMQVPPPVSKVPELDALLQRYFSFSIEAITDPEELAFYLAKRTRFLKDEIITIELAEEQSQGKRVLLNFYESFKKLLLNNLNLQQFADLYAQTLTYGIFVARTRSGEEFNRELIYKYIPGTLGILKSIFRFISLEEPPQAMAVLIDDIADILYNTNMSDIFGGFFKAGRGRDPIVHFYETFLSVYDPSLREKRGVYYTPEPVVIYIVDAIHSLLKSHFGKKDGFASQGVTILDPAAGTLTFPAEAIKLAIDEYEKNYGSGSVPKLIKEHILPNFHAIELMMAPYTVGHLKVSYLLEEQGYELGEDERFKLFLSNTLEPDIPQQIFLPIAQDISEECAKANEIKYQHPILVIMGNPPYSYDSANTNAWTEKLLKTNLDGAQSYYVADGTALGEKNPKGLQDDYVKFLRFAQWKIHKEGKGIVGMITNHGYLDNPTFRGMRQSMMNTFDEIYVLDLHGNSLKKEKTPEGGKDENVFEIRQGTAIVLMVKSGKHKSCRVYHRDLYGLRSSKYMELESRPFHQKLYQEVFPASPFYLFRPDTRDNEYYLKWISLPEIFPINSVGIITARDGLTIKESPEMVRKTVHHFASLEPETARMVYKLGKDVRDWKVAYAQKDLKDSNLSDANIKPILYRPFDVRHTYYTGKGRGFHCTPRHDVMKHMLHENLGLITGRQGLAVGDNEPWNLVTISQTTSDFNLFYRGGSLIMPLHLYPDDHKDNIFGTDELGYNISKELLEKLSSQWDAFQPEQLFYYIYAILHSNKYRQHFAQYLRMDFPRIPITNDFALFEKLASLGKELAEIHLFKSPLLHRPICKYQGSGANDIVEYVEYDEKNCIVRINADKHFDGVSPLLWHYYLGGYQVLDKYLKDRKGKQLADPIHYCRMVTAISLTMGLQEQIDKLIDPVIAKQD